MELLVRPATPSDVEAILEITHEAFEKYAFDLGSSQSVTALHEDRNALLRDMEKKLVLVGELDGQPVGSVRCEFLESGIAYFSRFGVKLYAQSCGMGGALVRAVVDAAKEREMRAIALHTSAKMFSLVRFYYGKGFFIHSTAADRGYLRALLVRELQPTREDITDYAALLPASY